MSISRGTLPLVVVGWSLLAGGCGVCVTDPEQVRLAVIGCLVVAAAVWGVFWWWDGRRREQRYPSQWIWKLSRERRARRRLWRKRLRALRLRLGAWLWGPVRWCPCGCCARVRRAAWLEAVRVALFARELWRIPRPRGTTSVAVTDGEYAWLEGLVADHLGPGQPPIFPPIYLLDERGREMVSLCGLVERLADPPSGPAGRSGVARPAEARSPAMPAPSSFAGLPIARSLESIDRATAKVRPPGE